MFPVKFSEPEKPIYDQAVQIRLTKNQKETVDSLAAKYNIPVSTMVRIFLLQAINQLADQNKQDSLE